MPKPIMLKALGLALGWDLEAPQLYEFKEAIEWTVMSFRMSIFHPESSEQNKDFDLSQMLWQG